MRSTKKVNLEIGRIVKKHGVNSAIKLFKALSRTGGGKFRDAMRRVHRIAGKI